MKLEYVKIYLDKTTKEIADVSNLDTTGNETETKAKEYYLTILKDAEIFLKELVRRKEEQIGVIAASEKSKETKVPIAPRWYKFGGV